MHNQGSNIPAFLNKLNILVSDPQTDELIYWDPVIIRFSYLISELDRS